MAAPEPASALAALLATERAALLAGDLAALPGLIAGKERLVAALEEAGGLRDPAMLKRLRSAAEANQSLLDAALRGVRAAQDRLDLARSGGPALNTYDATGRPASVESGASRMERRA